MAGVIVTRVANRQKRRRNFGEEWGVMGFFDDMADYVIKGMFVRATDTNNDDKGVCLRSVTQKCDGIHMEN